MLRTRDVPSPGKRRALLASAATGAESAALQDEARQVAQRLLALDASDPAKHEALSYYKVWGGIGGASDLSVPPQFNDEECGFVSVPVVWLLLRPNAFIHPFPDEITEWKPPFLLLLLGHP